MMRNKGDLRLNNLKQIKSRLKEKVLAKVKTNSGIILPDNNLNVLSNIEIFAEKHLDEFLTLSYQVIPQFTEVDLASLLILPTVNAKKFIGLYEFLMAKDIPSPKDYKMTLNFWCGAIARQKALSQVSELSDSKVPAIAILFDLVKSLQEVQGVCDDYIVLLNSAVSQLYARSATGHVNIYINSDKDLEPAGLTVPNSFWNSELATLQLLRSRNIVTDLHLHAYDHKNQQWKKSLSLNAGEWDRLVIRRRTVHALDESKHVDTFKKSNMSVSEVHAWKLSQPRPGIKYGNLKRIALKWFNLSKTRPSRHADFGKSRKVLCFSK